MGDDMPNLFTLCDLPDVFLLKLFKKLYIRDLVNAVIVWPSLRELLQSSTSTFHGRQLEYKHCPNVLWDLVSILPNVEWLTVSTNYRAINTKLIMEKSCQDKMNGNGMHLMAYFTSEYQELLCRVSGGLRGLTVDLFGSDLCLNVLQSCNTLEYLSVQLHGRCKVTGGWPQDLVLPKLTVIRVEYEMGSPEEMDSSLSTLYELAHAHRFVLKSAHPPTWRDFKLFPIVCISIKVRFSSAKESNHQRDFHPLHRMSTTICDPAMDNAEEI